MVKHNVKHTCCETDLPLETSPHLSLTNFQLDFNLMCHIFRTLPTEIWIIQYHPISSNRPSAPNSNWPSNPIKKPPPENHKIYIYIDKYYIYIYYIYYIYIYYII